MGMRDESWCNGCGTSVTYTEEEQSYCGDCGEDNAKQDLLSFVKERIEDLTQKREEYQNDNDYEMDDYCAGAIDAYDIIRMKLTD
jgi:tryptophanyl-tRNA synthetase